MDILMYFVLFCLGGIATMLLDILWWNINYKKIEKGLEILEHYHIGLALFIAAILTNIVFEPISLFMLGMGFVFIVAEWHQVVEIHNKKVIPGKPFAFGSTHFKSSSAIGGLLLGILLIISLVL